jgi:DNA-binding transcriptional LysR family regulator
MDRLRAMEIFTRVVEVGSFKRAAETLGVLPSSVTKAIKDLEAHLGVGLLNRTTRALSITDAGLRFYDSSKAILREVTAVEGEIAADIGKIRGSIRIGMTPSLARHFIIPQLSRFITRFPDVKIDLKLDDALVDLVQEGIDCVIRAGEPQASSLMVRRIATFRWYVCASPAYLERHGVPLTIDSLREHRAVNYASSVTGRSSDWTFRQGHSLLAVPMTADVTVDDTDACVEAGIAGLGLIRVASYMVRDHLAEGRLMRLLPALEAPEQRLSILYPQSRNLSSAVRAFIDWCVELIGAEARDW